LAIWLHGLDLKFLVNGEEVLSARDAALSQGILGVVARAGTGGQVSASFDDLRVYNLSDASAQPTGVPGAPSPPP
jgi:hypothetical protein